MSIAHSQFEKIQPTPQQTKILYALIKKRVHTISHQQIPSFKEHELFVHNNPYRAWFLIHHQTEYLGSFYLQEDNSIGINIIEGKLESCLPEILAYIQKNFSPLPPIKSLRNKNFTINVSSENTELMKLLETHQYKKLQVTYILT